MGVHDGETTQTPALTPAQKQMPEQSAVESTNTQATPIAAAELPSAPNRGTLPRLRSAVADTGRSVWRTSRRPAGRLTTAGLIILALVTSTAAAGATLVPSLIKPTASPETPTPSAAPPTSAAATPSTESPTASAGPTPTAPGRPADQFAVWAGQTSVKVGVPTVALQAYGYAEWVLSQTQPTCKLTWTTLAAIGKIESNHGSTGGAALDPQGRALPAIVGPALDGTKNNKKIPDTDAGALDNDKTWDHAVGPMQFLPTTWRAFAVDADSDQIADPHDLDDASLAAAYFLCASGKDLSVVANWKAVVLSYNNVGVYLQKVYDTAQSYGLRSKP